MICKINDLDIYYEIHGEGTPVLMIHGYSADHHLMTGCMEPVFQDRNDWQRIYIDLPGMGNTPSKEWIQSSDHMLDLVIGFIDKVIGDRDFLIAGESYGGYLTMGLLNKLQSKILGVLLLCPMVIPQFEKKVLPEKTVLVKDQKFLESLSVEYVKDEDDAEDVEDFEDVAVVQTEQIWKRFANELLPGYHKAEFEFLTAVQKNGYALSFDNEILNTPCEKPSLILTGRQDHVVGFKDQYKLIDLFPRASYVTLDFAGHQLQMEQPALFNELAKEWLNRVLREIK